MPLALRWCQESAGCSPVATPPREFAERNYDVRRWTDMPRGGHFPALEEPELLAEDIRAFFRDVR